jgi:hypothetical protein
MDIYAVFRALLAVHIVCGAVGLVAFWVPIFARKGGTAHRRIGQVFAVLMLVAGTAAIGMTLATLADPLATHPHLIGHAVFGDPALLRAIFGWMMLGLAVLTVNLAWYGWQCARHRRQRELNRGWVNLTLQGLLTAAAVACIWQALHMDQPLLLGMPTIGLATVGTNLFYLYKPRVGPFDWQKEHLKALVGAGISVYTAFLAFGAVRTFPELALHPGLWAVPLVVGLTIILFQWRRLDRAGNPQRLRPAA